MKATDRVLHHVSCQPSMPDIHMWVAVAHPSPQRGGDNTVPLRDPTLTHCSDEKRSLNLPLRMETNVLCGASCGPAEL